MEGLVGVGWCWEEIKAVAGRGKDEPEKGEKLEEKEESRQVGYQRKEPEAGSSCALCMPVPSSLTHLITLKCALLCCSCIAQTHHVPPAVCSLDHRWKMGTLRITEGSQRKVGCIHTKASYPCHHEVQKSGNLPVRFLGSPSSTCKKGGRECSSGYASSWGPHPCNSESVTMRLRRAAGAGFSVCCEEAVKLESGKEATPRGP